MKKSTLISTISMAFLMLVSININAQDYADLDKSPMDAASYPTSYKESKKLIKIVYSRPQLKERPLEKLAPNGEVWRTGANEAAELTLYTTMVFGEKKVDAGTYTFYVIPGETEWTAIISKDLNVWGSYSYNEENDFARVTVPVVIAKESMEVFSIAFSEADKGIEMHLAWDDVRITIPFAR
ncbi:DUF2911 domain-containing protein [Psychroserpens jangbogonensis]|uniref:DUF2911 domain-containing protein n=1 Tax=Psychroserpens jangbogonensis TaxID=1484460 RepID=UPI00053E857D|nr:DUF2911 domain-containing protein [Psychroserpens jangbogonensis]